jgi:L-fuconolactonase
MAKLIVDAHQHFWELGRFHYPWLTRDLGILYRNYLPQDLKSVLGKVGIDRTILVQATHSEDETKWLLDLADQNDFVGGVVGWVDLTSPRLSLSLEHFASRAKLVGSRHQAHDEPDALWLVREDVLAGLGMLSQAGLAYDLLVRTPHLPCVSVIAERYPDLRLVVDHIAKPPIARREFQGWAKAMEPLGRYRNVFCKLSGMITEANWSNWKPSDLKPCVDYVMDLFGPDRLMFGSDWPVCLLAGSYLDVWYVIHELVDTATAEAKDKIFGGTAVSFYQLES